MPFPRPLGRWEILLCVFVSVCVVSTMLSRMPLGASKGFKRWMGRCNESEQRTRYLHLLMHSLTGTIYQSRGLAFGNQVASKLGKTQFAVKKRDEGDDWPEIGYTMVGTKCLRNIQFALESAITKNVPGDFLEAGVWRGGSSIFAKGVLRAYGEDHIRKVWVCDSFKGLPKASSKKDGTKWDQILALRVDKATVQENFKRFDLLDDNVKFAEGYFVHSLPKVRSQVESLAVLRADGDMYGSTMDILFNLYDKLSVGGMCIIDDYSIAECQKAVTEFRKMHNITDTIITITDSGVKRYWIKTKQFSLNQQWYKTLLAERKPNLTV